MSEWDVICCWLYGLPIVLGPIAQAYAFEGTGNALTEFTKLYDHHRSIIPLNLEHLYSKVWWKMVIIYLMTIPISVSCSVWCGLYLFADELTTTQSLVWGVEMFFASHLYVILPASSGEKQVF